MNKGEIRKELEEEAKKYAGKFFDVDKDRYFLQKRAQKWAEEDIEEDFVDRDWRNVLLFLLGETDEDKKRQQVSFERFVRDARGMFLEEHGMILTTSPHTHEALFIEEVIRHYINKARERGYLQGIHNHHFTEKAMHVLGLEEYYEDPLPVTLPDFTAIRSIATKDKELFPELEPLRAEVAGAIINFTNWEAALVVYMDSEYIGESLIINIDDDDNYLKYHETILKQSRAKVFERSDQFGNKICAAVFPRILLVTDYHRHFSKALTRINCTISYWSRKNQFGSEVDYRKMYEETVTLFKGTVLDLDWRGRSLRN